MPRCRLQRALCRQFEQSCRNQPMEGLCQGCVMYLDGLQSCPRCNMAKYCSTRCMTLDHTDCGTRPRFSSILTPYVVDIKQERLHNCVHSFYETYDYANKNRFSTYWMFAYHLDNNDGGEFSRLYEQNRDELIADNIDGRIIVATMWKTCGVEEDVLVASSIAHWQPQLTRCYVNSVLVDPDLRGQGIGRQLVDFIESECLRRFPLATHLALHYNNGSTHAFWTHLGFEEARAEHTVDSRIIREKLLSRTLKRES